MLTLKNAAILWLLFGLVLVLLSVKADAGTVFQQIPSVLEKAERSIARAEPERVIALLSGKVEGLVRPQYRAKGYGLLCKAYYQKQDYVTAEAFCDKAVDRAEPNWSQLNNRGVMRFKLARYADALADFKRAASIMMLRAPLDGRHSVKRNISSAEQKLEPI